MLMVRRQLKKKLLRTIQKKGIQISKKGIIPSRNNTVIKQTQDNLILPSKNKIIVLDPGNGGKDQSGKYLGGKDLLELCLLLANDLKLLGVQVFLTRKDESFCPVSSKAKTASEINPHFFISINCNYTNNTTLSGTEIFHYRGDEESALLAQLIKQKLKEHTLLLQKGVKVADLSLFREIKSKALVIEIGYISNENDREILTKEPGKKTIAQAICEAFTDYCSK